MFNFKFYNKYFGLMFQNLKNNDVAVLKDYKQEILHTFFVFYPIDIICLNDKSKVIYIKRDIKPFTSNIKLNKQAMHVLEFKSGFAKDIKIGQKINIP
ncbi:MAG: DUF192 domain-containing protein [Nanoarchaeota archaeon]